MHTMSLCPKGVISLVYLHSSGIIKAEGCEPHAFGAIGSEENTVAKLLRKHTKTTSNSYASPDINFWGEVMMKWPWGLMTALPLYFHTTKGKKAKKCYNRQNLLSLKVNCAQITEKEAPCLDVISNPVWSCSEDHVNIFHAYQRNRIFPVQWKNFSNTIGPLGLATHYPKWRRFGAPTSLFMQLARWWTWQKTRWIIQSAFNSPGGQLN